MKDYVKNRITVHIIKYIYELKIVDKIEVLNLQPLSWVNYDIQIL